MKKLLGISVIAMLAVAPAFADPVAGNPTAHTGTAGAATTNVEPEFALIEASTTDSNAASAGYVKGAYNAAIKAINKVNAKTTVNAGDGIAKTNNTVSVKAATNGGIAVDTNGVAVTAGDGIKVGANGVEVDLVSNGGLTTDTDGQMEVVVDGSTIEVNSTNGQIKIVDSGVGTTQLAADAVTNAKLADNAVQTENIVNGNVTLEKVASTAIQGGSAQGAANDKLTTKDYVDESISALSIGDYATKTGVVKTIQDTTLSQGAVTQGLTGSLGTGTIVTIMTSWDDQTSSTNVTGVTGIGTLTTDVSVAAPTINDASVVYGEPTT